MRCLQQQGQTNKPHVAQLRVAQIAGDDVRDTRAGVEQCVLAPVLLHHALQLLGRWISDTHQSPLCSTYADTCEPIDIDGDAFEDLRAAGTQRLGVISN